MSIGNICATGKKENNSGGSTLYTYYVLYYNRAYLQLFFTSTENLTSGSEIQQYVINHINELKTSFIPQILYILYNFTPAENGKNYMRYTDITNITATTNKITISGFYTLIDGSGNVTNYNQNQTFDLFNTSKI